jgi:hypothetical protein
LIIPHRRVLLNSPLLLLPLQRDRLVRMAVNARAQSFPATIRETSSRPIRYKLPRAKVLDLKWRVRCR